MRLTSTVLAVSELAEFQRVGMLDLMNRHYTGVRWDHFQRDLEEKTWVITINDSSGQLRGFSTQILFDAVIENRTIKVLFSGDTIIDRDYWGDSSLGHAWGHLALRLIRENPMSEMYWFLISQGFRTYRFLPLFFREFYPRFDAATPEDIQQLIHVLAESRYGNLYDRAVGIIRSTAEQYALRDEFGKVPDLRLRDPHIRYFVTANPHYADGDELCCIAKISAGNFTPAAWRVINRTPHSWEPVHCS